MLEAEARQRPTLRAVLECDHRIGHTEINERLGADDGARAARTVDDDLGVGIRRDVADAQHQLPVRAADAARDVHFVIFGEGAPVDDHEVFAGTTHGLQLQGGDARGVTLVLDKLAEGLARDVDAFIERVAGALPSRRPAGQDVHAMVAQCLRPLGGPLGDRVLAAIAKHHPDTPVRHEHIEAELETAVGQWYCKKEVALAELACLAHVDERDLAAVREPAFECRRIDCQGHGFPPASGLHSQHKVQ